MQKSVEISKIVEDVSYIISSKLRDALMPVVENQMNTESAILNLPFIQKILNENRALKMKNAELETKLAVVRENYKRLFLSNEGTTPKTHTSISNENEHNINLEIEEFHINKQDYASISNIEKEIMELNKDELESVHSDTEYQFGSSDDEDEDDEDEEKNKLNFFMTNNPKLCKKAIFNYKTFHRMQTTPSLEDVFNSAAGIRGWGSTTLHVNNETLQGDTVGVVKVDEEVEEEEAQEDEEEEEAEEEEEEEEVEEEEEEEEEEVEEEEEAEEEVEEAQEEVEEAQEDEEEEEAEEEEAEEEEAQEDEEEEEAQEEEEEVEEEEEEEVEEEEEEAEVEESEDEDEELEVEEIMIKGKMFYTDSPSNGDIYRVGEDGDIEDVVGKFNKSVAIFY